MKRWTIVVIGAFGVGALSAWLLLSHRTIPTQPQLFCDQAHKVPFIPANQCGGWTSCDRLFNGLPPCPK